MAVKGVVSDINEVPEALREHYKESDGKWVLDASDFVPSSKLREFRDNNNALNERISSYKDVDVEEYRQLKAEAAKAKEKTAIDAGDIEEVYNQRLAPLKAAHGAREAELLASVQEKEARLSKFMIDSAIRDAAVKNGAHASAIEDMILRGNQVFKMKGDKVVPLAGNEVVYGKNGEPLGFDEWVGSLASSAPHLFQSSQGAGTPKAGTHSAALGGNKIARGDSAAFLSNLDDIAAGKKTVV